MEPVVFNNGFLAQHPMYAQCHSTLNAVSERDYSGRNCFDSQIECLDMDTYETKICNGQADRTADAVIAISTCQNKKTSAHRLQLVELRMGYENADNLSRSELERKVSHTKQLLSSVLPIDQFSLFVFTETVAPQARHWIESKMHEGGDLKYFKAWSVQDFNNNVKSVDDMPYNAIYAPTDICKELDRFVTKSEWGKLFAKLHFWLKLSENLRYSNVFEYESLGKTILDWWKSFREQHVVLPADDDEIEALILDEDIPIILK